MGTKAAVRVEDLDTLPPLPEGQQYELSQGEVVIVVGKSDLRHEVAKSRVAEKLLATPEIRGLGEVLMEACFFLGPDTARMPDVAFVSRNRVRQAGQKLATAPEIAVEIVSPSDTAMDVERKVDEYLAAGVIEIWNVFTEQRFVRVRTKDGIRDLGAAAILTTPVLPGFSARVADLFAE